MAGASFKLDWSAMDRAVSGGLSRIRQTQELAENLGEMLVASTQQRFEDEESPDGEKWTPSQRAIAEHGQTLKETGALRNSIGYEASPGLVAVGTNKVQGRIHQLGGKAGRGHSVSIEARPYLGFSDEDLEEAKELVVEFLHDCLKP